MITKEGTYRRSASNCSGIISDKYYLTVFYRHFIQRFLGNNFTHFAVSWKIFLKRERLVVTVTLMSKV